MLQPKDWLRLRLTGEAATDPTDASGTLLFDLARGTWANDPGSGGAWIGLTLAHQRDDLMRAALEGVAFLLRGKLEDMRAAGCAPERIRLAGGGTRHPAWRQLLADVLAVPRPAPDCSPPAGPR
jgi:sugar (pentulose or hexulose) kinase